ncbi:SpoIIE family protein phosphatase [Streptomyces venezuelae]|uniref:SpoIIE family protein phosphatase n=1 Tax=Streptomyces venezuelae TaxID=54571 RepID=UPI003319C06C
MTAPSGRDPDPSANTLGTTLPPATVAVVVASGPRRVLARVGGEIDPDNAPQLYKDLTAALGASRSGLDLDLSAVTFCDSAGLHILLDLNRLATQSRKSLALTALSRPLDRLLKITGTRPVFTFGDSIDTPAPPVPGGSPALRGPTGEVLPSQDTTVQTRSAATDAALIERTTGVLMASLRMCAQEASDELTRRAREGGRSVAEEAGLILDRFDHHHRPAPNASQPIPESGSEAVFSSRRYLSGSPSGRAPSGGGRTSSRHADGPRRPRAPRRLARQQEFLDGLAGSVIVLSPIRGPGGAVEDYVIDAASPGAVDVAGRTGKELVGMRVLQAYPTVAGTALWAGYQQALETGTVWVGKPFEYEEIAVGIPHHSRFQVQAAPWRGGLVVSWEQLDAGEREQHRLAVTERLGNLGWADWDLVTNTITWSEQVYAIFGRDVRDGPISLEELPRHVVGEDLPALGGTVQRLLGEGRPVDHSFRIITMVGVRHVRIVAEAERDAGGATVEVHGFFQDITATKAIERELVARQIAAVAQQSQLLAERELAARLQHALLPVPQQSLRLAGLHVDVAYQSAQHGLNVGGDWYSAIELPDGSAFLVVGDVAGHGVDSVATMAQLRFTAKGMAITGTPLTDILTRLNALLLHTADGHSAIATATVIMARYEPASRRLTWARAGHPPPLLVREGHAHYLEQPEGMLLGATHEARYAEAAITLDAGDQLLLYTDGLIEKPTEDITEGLARLALAAASSAAAHPTPGLGVLKDLLTSLPDRADRRDDVCILHITV